MYHLEILPFGDFERFVFRNHASGNGFTLVPHFGACVLDVQFGGRSVLDGYTTPEQMQINKWGKNTLLFPFPNRLKDGQYTWQEQHYQFPVNDADTGNALHGFGMDKEMRVKDIETEEDFAEITCIYSTLGEHSGYPFPFTFAVRFQMKEPAQFEVEMLFQNDGEIPMPVGFGWHPYYQLSDAVEAMELRLPSCEKIVVDARMIPTGQREDFTHFSTLKPIGNTILDNCFALMPDKGKAELLIKGSRGTLHYWQETGADKFNFLQIFTPPHRHSIAVEPMTCNIDAFHNGEGLITLAPGTHAHARFGFSWEKLP